MKESERKSKEQETIIVRGARTHNLKNITVEMPRNKIRVQWHRDLRTAVSSGSHRGFGVILEIFSERRVGRMAGKAARATSDEQ